MTVKEFKEYAKRGLGRCITQLKTCKNIEKYRKAVLECCLKNSTFDTFIEGTHAWYIHELVSFYNDDDYFLTPVIEKFNGNLKSNWDFLHFSELIMEFALEGNEKAKNALWSKYEILHTKLLNNDYGKYETVSHHFENVSISLTSVGKIKAFLKIAEDMGELFLKCPQCKAEDFEWFYVNFKGKAEDIDVDGVLKEESDKSAHLKAFYDDMCEYTANAEKIRKKSSPKPTIDEIIAKSGNVKFIFIYGKRASAEDKLKVANAIVNEPDSGKKARLLGFFQDVQFPLDHAYLIEYINSGNKKLQRAARYAVNNCRSEVIRNYALGLIKNGDNSTYLICTLIENYRKEDEILLFELLNSMEITRSGKNGWHDVMSAIFHAVEENAEFPKKTLSFIYEKTLCSECRFHAVREMAKLNMLTDEIKEECAYDSDYDIFEFIEELKQKGE